MTYLPHLKRFATGAALFAAGLLVYGFGSARRDVLAAERLAVLAEAARRATPGTRLAPECARSNTAFTNGERVVYKIYYNLNFIWIPAGEVTFDVRDVGEQYKLTATGETYASYEWFFKVKDRYESYVDKETLLPTKAVRDIREGNYELYELIDFDQPRRAGVCYRGHSVTEAMAQPKAFTTESCPHDVLSAIYFMRNHDLSGARPGDLLPLTVVMSNKVHDLDVRYVGRDPEKKIKGLGRFDAAELAPQILGGDVFSEDSEMRVWAATNAGHLPLMIESPVSVGSVKAVLKSHERLRHPLVER